VAEVLLVINRVSAGESGEMVLTLTVEDTQVTTDDRGRPSPLVVSVLLLNSSDRPGHIFWQRTAGNWQWDDVLPTEDMEVRYSPPNRQPLHLWLKQVQIPWGA
jgi:hypothetical protein